MGAKSTGVSAFTNMGLLKPLIYKQCSKVASDSDTEYFIILLYTQKSLIIPSVLKYLISVLGFP